MSNYKNIGTALEMYAADNEGHYPPALILLTPSYLKTMPTCASAGKDTYSASYEVYVSPDGKSDTYTFFCMGNNHEWAKEYWLGIIPYRRRVNIAPPNFPQYISIKGLIDRLK